MLFYQMSRMCREKGAVKHDDRLDCISQAVQYYTDALAISAYNVIRERKRDEWNSLIEDFIENPQNSANHMVLGMNKEQRNKARGLESGKPVPTWI